MFTRTETVAHIPIGDSSHVLRTPERRKRHQLQNAMKSNITILTKRVILVQIQTCIRHITDMFTSVTVEEIIIMRLLHHYIPICSIITDNN